MTVYTNFLPEELIMENLSAYLVSWLLPTEEKFNHFKYLSSAF